MLCKSVAASATMKPRGMRVVGFRARALDSLRRESVEAAHFPCLHPWTLHKHVETLEAALSPQLRRSPSPNTPSTQMTSRVRRRDADQGAATRGSGWRSHEAILFWMAFPPPGIAKLVVRVPEGFGLGGGESGHGRRQLKQR